MSEALKGQTALVTGASRGIGRSIALGLADLALTLLSIMQVAKRLRPRLWKRFAQRRIGHRG